MCTCMSAYVPVCTPVKHANMEVGTARSLLPSFWWMGFTKVVRPGSKYLNPLSILLTSCIILLCCVLSHLSSCPQTRALHVLASTPSLTSIPARLSFLFLSLSLFPSFFLFFEGLFCYLIIPFLRAFLITFQNPTPNTITLVLGFGHNELWGTKYIRPESQLLSSWYFSL